MGGYVLPDDVRARLTFDRQSFTEDWFDDCDAAKKFIAHLVTSS